jgi:hypothetical protein
MLESIPQTAWIRVLDYLGLTDSCHLRTLNKSIKDRVEEDIFYIYKRIEGKKDDVISEFLDTNFIYPKLDLPKLLVPLHNYLNITTLFTMLRYNHVMDLIESKEMFRNILHRTIINGLDIKKLLKVLKLVLLGLSEHYSIQCMPLTNERIDWAISFKSVGICDLFCYRGAAEFNESQKNNFLKINKYTYQDCYTFEAAEQLSDAQIDIMIEKKNENMLDYYALNAALEHDV